MSMILQQTRRVLSLANRGARGPAGLDLVGAVAPGNFLVKAPGGDRAFQGASGTGADAGLRPDLAADGGSANVGYNSGLTGAQTMSLLERISGQIELWDFMTLAMRADARGGGLSVDITPAWDAAVAAATFPSVIGGNPDYTSGLALYVRPYHYLKSSTIQLKKRMRVMGDGSGLDLGGAATFHFPAGVTGVIVNNTQTPDTTHPFNADGSILEGLRLQGSGNASDADAYGGHGVWFRGPALLEKMQVQGFAGNGLNVVADTGTPSGGNANLWRARLCRLSGNKGHGLYTQGGDANAGYAEAIDATGNGGFGIRDDAFLMNTYVACHAASNTLGAYKALGLNARTMFLNCYSEGDQPPSQIMQPAMVYGGLHGAGFTADSTAYIMGAQASEIGYQGMPGCEWSDTANSYSLRIGKSQAAGTNDAGFIVLEDTNETSGAHPFALKAKAGGWFFDWAANLQPLWALTNSLATVANGWAREVATVFTQFTGAAAGIAIPRGFVFGSKLLYRGTGSAAPTTGTWAQGDKIENDSPTAGGFSGWICTSAGTPGTWKTFGAISA